MDEREKADVLVVGAGPVGLTAALELRRRGVDARIVDRIVEPPRYAKAVGVQPRTLELWDAMGVVRPALDASTALRGQLIFRNGEMVNRMELTLPDEVAYRFIALPQYETERILGAALSSVGTSVDRGVEFLSFEQDESEVRSTVQDRDGRRRVIAARFLVGCDGAHSAVRRGLGIDFSGGAFVEGYMLGDVELDWDLPQGYAIRATHERDGTVTDLLVCIPLPGTKRYRISALVDPELEQAEEAGGTDASDGVQHGLQGGRRPELVHIQRVLDRMAPEPATASTLRWSSVFRISHRLAERYGVGRVFLAGDAAHIHPPTGAQGMNTGIQDAINLGWKLALAVHGRATGDLLDSYHAERHPVGAEVVGRTVAHARAGFGTGGGGLQEILMREAQLLVGYPDSPVVGEDGTEQITAGPLPGQRAPDASGLRQDTMSAPLRFAELLRHPGFTLLLWAGDADGSAEQLLAASLSDVDELRCYVVLPAAADGCNASGIVFRDTDGQFAAAYGTARVHSVAYLIRPDGYVGYRTGDVSEKSLRGALTHVGIREG